MDKDYWRLKKREQRAKKLDTSVGQTVELDKKIEKIGQVHTEEMSKCPTHIDPKEWKHACERAARSRKYAAMFPNHVKPSEEKFQDPLWQWENEVKGRFGGVVGGSLSETRGES